MLDSPITRSKVGVDSKSGRKIQDVDCVPEAVKHNQHIILHLGTNNLSDGDAPSTIAGRFEKLIDDIRRVNPDSSIYVSSILPRAVSGFSGSKMSAENIVFLNEKARRTNYLVTLAISRIERCHVINNNSLFMDSLNVVKTGLLSKDGLHLQRAGIIALIVELVCRRFNGTCYYTTQPRTSPSISLDYSVWIGDLYTLTVLYCMEFEYS
ncbi:uncharacterized protein LOC111051939 isoform X2 [Nilaparvata lugens]|uniref:uncharacterized protein LOC111054010 n=1 Tax=Nilaparvata lugens TaxID=108931 RepID=UPI00193E43AA|nr:uncharacterized protein LOC111054010 [Nilaparvata lugens]XP_039299265.1 uncharacterized protein LOC111051939 isoform X2 [Nilaparvata lugens]XP_039299266.1 uncharacterized protein LOC111051939 isoform X2 [Nilaparvata lugens]XP_039299267.1 uncharacterized protein LOC111051939 isoform X2 [Nilaparvata lugens]